MSMGFSRQEYWSGLPCPLPVDLPDSGIKLESLMSPALAGRFFIASATWKALFLRQLGPQSFLLMWKTLVGVGDGVRNISQQSRNWEQDSFGEER